jgi:hypothetical protein
MALSMRSGTSIAASIAMTILRHPGTYPSGPTRRRAKFRRTTAARRERHPAGAKHRSHGVAPAWWSSVAYRRQQPADSMPLQYSPWLQSKASRGWFTQDKETAMSRHCFSTKTHDGITVDVETGWDATAKGYFLVVRMTGEAANDNWDDPDLFSTDRLPRSQPLPQRYEPLRSILDGFGVVLPISVLNDVVIDRVMSANADQELNAAESPTRRPSRASSGTVDAIA